MYTTYVSLAVIWPDGKGLCASFRQGMASSCKAYAYPVRNCGAASVQAKNRLHPNRIHTASTAGFACFSSSCCQRATGPGGYLFDRLRPCAVPRLLRRLLPDLLPPLLEAAESFLPKELNSSFIIGANC
ncbi:hypothetical protein SAMN04487970_104714 [Paenibacillus tianmuensis]|uniref:Uncharacterized protein n=1 Tax=Paenibacillus tianmuensis TaxID=624147 RepID=A0A1G4TCW0_9BACL|nr:hypothetical protein SAMN04487970_104714 [Paenibacillus tianmuensis]